MPKSATKVKSTKKHLDGELLDFYDDLTAVNAGMAFVLQAFAIAMQSGEPTDHRTASGATFCVDLLNKRTLELEQQMAGIRSRLSKS